MSEERARGRGRAVAGDRALTPISKLETIEATARRLGYDFRGWRVAKREDFGGVFRAIEEAGSQALYCTFTALTFRERHRIVEFANSRRLPSAFGAVPFVEAGGLMSYAANRLGMTLDSLGYVDRILRGAKPAELPVEIPSKFELALNLKTARLLGLEVPRALELRADKIYG